eukprot:TRINITY_DN14889_c0_g1_i1.p1 TRINITY_DN14889_c0_g1~~TRINITY_DN14889_c0_g1_i1.p1  ORF type:complete len:330 (-),score=60.82 TRINITY_DN14889_c0_g1_i1:220-1209(-)
MNASVSFDGDILWEIALYLSWHLIDVAAVAATCRGAMNGFRGPIADDIAIGDIDACCAVLAFAKRSGLVAIEEVRAKPASRLTLLSQAASHGRPDVIRFLLRYIYSRRDVDHLDNYGASALHYAALEGRGGVCRVLIDFGAKVNITDKSGVSPLQLAAENGHASTCGVLVQAGADVNTCDKDFNTPVIAAAREGQQCTCRLLAAAGADVIHPNLAGQSALGIAQDSGDFCFLRSLTHPPPAAEALKEVGVGLPPAQKPMAIIAAIQQAQSGGHQRPPLSRLQRSTSDETGGQRRPSDGASDDGWSPGMHPLHPSLRVVEHLTLPPLAAF